MKYFELFPEVSSSYSSTSFVYLPSQISSFTICESSLSMNPCSNVKESTEFIDIHHPSVVLSNLAHFRDQKFMCDIEIEVSLYFIEVFSSNYRAKALNYNTSRI